MTKLFARRLAIALVTVCAFPPFLTLSNAQDTSLTPQIVVEKAAVSNAFEIEAAKLALERANDPSVKTFARDMVTDHEQAGQALAKAAEEENIEIPQTLDAEHRSKLNALKGSAEKDFDQAYLSTQVLAHEEAVALFDNYAQTSSGGPLKSFAEKTLGTLRAHNVRIHGLTKQ
jgi:putative membrane protein